jgi:uncharacterized membrane protein YdcZ (DUF606 family)
MSNDQKLDKIENLISQIKGGKIKMKPKWYFLLGSTFITIALIGLIIGSTFLVSLITFSLKTHGPMGAIRFERLLNSFPWWAPILTIIGFALGIILLKKYDFSYKKNFITILGIIFISILLSGFLIDHFGFDDLWIKRGPMRKFYQRYSGQGMMKNLDEQKIHYYGTKAQRAK